MAQCHHGVCSGIVDCTFPSIEIDRHLVPTGIFFVFQISNYVRNAYAKRLPMKYQRKGIVGNFHRGCQYEQLEGKEGQKFSATKTNLENRRQEVERVAESKVVPNRHVFVYIFG